MTAKKPAMSKEKAKKLKIKKETLKDLDTDGRAKVIKGGAVHSNPTGLVECSQGGC